MFSERLQKIMKEKNIKPSELSVKANVDKASISNYLSGNYVPKNDKLYKIAKVLNVNPVWLLGYDVPQDTDETIPDNDKREIALRNAIMDLSSSPREKELLFKCTQLNHERKLIAIEHINLLLKEQGYFKKDEFGDWYDPNEADVCYWDM